MNNQHQLLVDLAISRGLTDRAGSLSHLTLCELMWKASCDLALQQFIELGGFDSFSLGRGEPEHRFLPRFLRGNTQFGPIRLYPALRL